MKPYLVFAMTMSIGFSSRAGLTTVSNYPASGWIQAGNIGVGIARWNEEEPVRIVSVFRGSPAEDAGVKSNSFIISIDGTSVVSESSERCMRMMHGTVGTPVTLELADPKMTQTNKFTIERADVDIGNDLFLGMSGTNKPFASSQGASLTPEQATALALRLANNKAARLYDIRPFQASQPPRIVGGQWVWTDTRGFGRGDIKATVELAADGSRSQVELQILVNQDPLFPGGGGGRGF